MHQKIYKTHFVNYIGSLLASKDVDPFKGQVLYEAEGIEGLQIQ